MKKMCELAMIAFVIACAGGCATKGIVCVDGGPLKAEHVATLDGFKYPECALYHGESGRIFVSNIDCAPEEYWVDDSKGFISLVDKSNTIKDLHWVKSNPESCPIHSPKGMTVLGKHLYFADNTRLLRCTLAGRNVETIASGFQKANDLCTDGKSVWLSDVGASKIYCISPKGKKREIKAPKSVNGITFDGAKMFGVSWDLHDVYELDPTGKKAPVPFGLAEYFTTLDGIEVLADGTFIVSDFKGHQICTIKADRKTVNTLVRLETPADIGVDREAGMLYVPQLLVDKLSIFKYSVK